MMHLKDDGPQAIQSVSTEIVKGKRPIVRGLLNVHAERIKSIIGSLDRIKIQAYITGKGKEPKPRMSVKESLRRGKLAKAIDAAYGKGIADTLGTPLQEVPK